MSVLSIMTADIEILEPHVSTERGVETSDWSAEPAMVTIVEGCSIQPGPPVETLGGRNASEVRWTVFAPPGILITAHSAVRLDGRIYQIDGEPQRWTSASGTLDHTVIRLVDWEG